MHMPISLLALLESQYHLIIVVIATFHWGMLVIAFNSLYQDLHRLVLQVPHHRMQKGVNLG